MFNFNSGYGQGIALAQAARNTGSGRVLIVCPSNSQNYDMLTQIFKNDPNGKARFFTTLGSAMAQLLPGDVLIAGEGFYDETGLALSGISNLTLVGMGGRGAMGIEPSAAGAEGLLLTSCDDVTTYNFGVAGNATADYALQLTSCARFRSYGSKYEGPTGTIISINGTATDQCADILFEDYEVAWGGKGFTFDDSLYGYPTQINIKKGWFHDITDNMLGVATGGLVKGLSFTDNDLDNAEDGTAPTDYILLSDNGNTGTIGGNRFATATNATGVITIGTGLKYPTNYTEAGPSTARPA